jgi:diguanylate cyclase (GGDEF)-like protein/PAS domain S-box-containing protein
MSLAAALIYWVIVVLWLAVLSVLFLAFNRNPTRFGPMRLLLWVVAIDTIRNIIENLYFGLYFGAQYGLFPNSIVGVLGNPSLLIVPKILNVVAASVVLGLLLFRWVPRIMKERTQVQNDLHHAEWKFQLLVDGVNEYAIYLLDPKGNVTSWNSGAQRIKGYSAAEIIGKHVSRFYSEEDRAAGKPAEALEIAKRDGRFETKAWRVRKYGTRFWANVVIDAIRDNAGQLIGFAKVTKDVTESLRAEELLLQLAHFDQLTGLSNRTSLMNDLARAMDSNPPAAAIGMFDLDGFKDINDSFSHSAGDRVLEEVADRARKVVGSVGQFYRLGGDEFVLMLPTCRDPLVVTDVVNSVLRAIEEAIEIDGHRIYVGASAGIAIAPNGGSDPEELLAHADLALYEAKESGGRQYSMFVPTMRAKVRARQELENELRRACSEREFTLHYQPQISLCDGAIVGAEALLRWKHPTRGLLAPGVFIEALTRSPFALEVGNWVLQTACKTAASWRALELPPLRIGVNLFPAQFHDVGLVMEVESALRNSGLPAEALELEITENIALGHDEVIMAKLRALRAKGVGLAFDDFGTGYASLSYLTKYPLTRVKIDRSFVRSIAKKCPQEATAIVRSMIVMAHNLGFEVIAEGVETSYQAKFLQSKRCDEVQGYLYAAPLAADEFKTFVLDYAKRDRVEANALATRLA